MEEYSDARFKQRAVTESLTAEKVPPTEIHRRMQAVYGDQCVDVSTVRRWVRRFQRWRIGGKQI
jgi:transposase-like protein